MFGLLHFLLSDVTQRFRKIIMDLKALRGILKSESDKEGNFHYTNHIFLFLRAFEAPISFTFSMIPESTVVVRRDHTSQGIPYQVDVNGLNGAKSGVKKR